MFQSPDALAALYPSLARFAITDLGSKDTMQFLGKPLVATYRGEVVTNYKVRPEGICVRHAAGGNSTKMYDKQGSFLRVETTTNEPWVPTRRILAWRNSFAGRCSFWLLAGLGPQEAIWRSRALPSGAVRRQEERPRADACGQRPRWEWKRRRRADGDPDSELKQRPLRKGIADIKPRAQAFAKANDRYLDSLAAVDSDRTVEDVFDKVLDRAEIGGRSARALKPWAAPGVSLLRAVGRGEFITNGFRSRVSRACSASKCPRILTHGWSSWSSSPANFDCCVHTASSARSKAHIDTSSPRPAAR